jgi:hypothetical protein
MKGNYIIYNIDLKSVRIIENGLEHKIRGLRKIIENIGFLAMAVKIRL